MRSHRKIFTSLAALAVFTLTSAFLFFNRFRRTKKKEDEQK